MRAKQSELLTTTHGKSAACIVARSIISCQAIRLGPASRTAYRVRLGGQLPEKLVQLRVIRQQLANRNRIPLATAGALLDEFRKFLRSGYWLSGFAALNNASCDAARMPLFAKLENDFGDF